MKYLLITLALFMLTFVLSCEKELDFSSEVKQPKLVLNALINLDSTFQVSASYSSSILSNKELDAVDNAVVKLFDSNDNLLEQLQADNNGMYVGNTIVKANTTYKVTAEHPDYTSVSAETFIPTAPEILSVDTTTINNLNGRQKQFTIKLKDDATQKDYYMVELTESSYYKNWENPDDSSLTESSIYLYSPNLVFENSGNEGVDGQRLLLQDGSFNGSSYTFSVNCPSYLFGENSNQNSTKNLRISKISEATFFYFNSLYKYEMVSNNPFANPVQVYSNVENGFGILGGRSMFSLEF